MRTRLVLLGPPASGKGTQSDKIQAAFGIEPASPGAILRQEKQAGTPLGIEADSYFSVGRLCPDDLIVAVVKNWLAPRNGAPFLFDGFPRSIGQAAGLEQLLHARGTPLDAAISLEADADVIRHRIEHRRICASCGNIVSLGLHVPTDDSPCPRCGKAALTRRGDDNLASLEVRMREYREKSEPVLAWYEKRNLLHTIDATAPIDDVFNKISTLLNNA